jgi:hypothetical protein
VRKFNRAIFFGGPHCIHELGALHQVVDHALSTLSAQQQSGLQGTVPLNEPELELEIEDAIKDFARALGREVDLKPLKREADNLPRNESVPTVSVPIWKLCHFDTYAICAEAYEQGILEPLLTKRIEFGDNDVVASKTPSFAWKPLGVDNDNVLFAVRPVSCYDDVERGWSWYLAD